MEELTFEQAREIVKRHPKWHLNRARKDFVYVFPNEPFMRKYPLKTDRLVANKDIQFDVASIVVEGFNKLCHPTEDVKKAGEIYFEMVRKDNHSITFYADKFKKSIELFEKVSQKLNIEIKKENLDEISKNFLESTNLTIDLSPEGLFLWILLESPLEDFLKRQLTKKYSESEVNEIIGVLSQPLTPTFFYQAREELLNLIRIMPPDIKTQIKNSSDVEIINLLKEYSLTRELFESYIEKYEWIPFDYIGPNMLDWPHLAKEIKEILKNGLENEIKKQDNFKNLNSKQEQIIEKYNIEGEIKDLFLVFQELNEFFDYRKRAFSRIALKMSKFFEKIADFYCLEDYRDLYWMTPEEHLDFIRTGKIDLDIIKQRKKSVIVIFSENCHGIFQGKEADELISYILVKQNLDAPIKGNIASTAGLKVIQGKARVLLSPSECGLMQNQEILIAAMTNPPYMLAMRKASAIVTDEGGVACHAAIVARELSIPCIVGTTIATQKIKTGDEIELNLETGEVRILN